MFDMDYQFFPSIFEIFNGLTEANYDNQSWNQDVNAQI